MNTALGRTPLYARHRDAGARLVPFAGFEMPVVYTSILEEHHQVRQRAGLFDVSHMGEIRLRGREAVSFAQHLFSNDVQSASVGRVRYGFFCDEKGGVVDDVTLYRLPDAEILFCVNAGNTATDLAWIRKVQAEVDPDCEIIDESDQTALLALQGPEAVRIAAALLPKGTKAPRRWHFIRTDLADIPVLLSRTGYTGEDGYEIYAPAEAATKLWDALREAGRDDMGLAGLGARDTLRTEMAYPLHGHELDREHTPIAAGLERFLAFGRDFIGERALARIRAEGPATRLVGLVIEGRQVARNGYSILEEQKIGMITSGTYGPSVGQSIAIGYVAADRAIPGARLHVEVRNRPIPCHITETPFYSEQTRKAR